MTPSTPAARTPRAIFDTGAAQATGSVPAMAAACACETPQRGFLAGLLAAGASTVLPGCGAPVTSAADTGLKRFYYDTAWAANPMALGSLTRLVDAS